MARHSVRLIFASLALANDLRGDRDEAEAVGPWRRIDGARFETQHYSDGDSFGLRHDGTVMVYRLYYVDAPESDERYPQRVREQARHFGVAVARLPGLGRSAAAFTAQWLAAEPVTIWTRDEPVDGRTTRGRRFALIARGRRWLHEELVSAGWARVYGMGVDLPDGTSMALHWRQLNRKEAEARRERRGAWAASRALERRE